MTNNEFIAQASNLADYIHQPADPGPVLAVHSPVAVHSPAADHNPAAVAAAADHTHFPVDTAAAAAAHSHHQQAGCLLMHLHTPYYATDLISHKVELGNCSNFLNLTILVSSSILRAS
jgi:hypothetical protein